MTKLHCLLIVPSKVEEILIRSVLYAKQTVKRVNLALQLGQFFAARAEFVPAPICRSLSRLHDQARQSFFQ